MKPVFGEDGHATSPGEVRAYYFDHITGEYTGWSDEFINMGVSMPGCSTDIDPGEEISGFAMVFTGKQWEKREDHRGITVYATTDRKASVVDYIGEIREGFTAIAPSTHYDKWTGGRWVTDAVEKTAADIAAAESDRQRLLNIAQQRITVWQTKLLMGRKLTESEASQLNAWMDYIDAVTDMDTSPAPSLEWPSAPA
ncbi:tail fiber assembly protein [Lelliottia amnigena]|uniref:tail fiber assembly protein n=1 Tax=Lelliottia amnigena TaxID=61646 RepID=UPI00209025E7|nr:tail fiber assembly protein [Lelliottia amnigena]USR60671.1 tail fiber assembly protein [Lelliottia amnigena]